MRVALALLCYLEPALIRALSDGPDGLFNLLNQAKQQCNSIMDAEALIEIANEPRCAHMTL